MPPTTDDIVEHVCHYGRWSPELGKYYVRWAGKLFTAEGTRELVEQITHFEKAV